jgi:hypothetical protein
MGRLRKGSGISTHASGRSHDDSGARRQPQPEAPFSLVADALFFKYVLSSETAVTDVASTLVHEAQHARLWRLGFSYEEMERARIELTHL